MSTRRPRTTPQETIPIMNDDNDASSSSPSTQHHQSSSSAPLEIPETYFESQVDQLIQELADLGFDSAFSFIQRYGTDRVKQAIDRARSLPEGTIENMGGYIRHIVTSRGPIAKPYKPPPPKRQGHPKAQRDPDRYTKGKYGHLVKR